MYVQILHRFQVIVEQIKQMNRQLGDRLIKIDNSINLDPIQDNNFREKNQLVDQVSNLANEVTDSMAQLEEVNNSILEMKKNMQDK